MGSEFAGSVVVSFESRRSDDMRRLIEKRGAVALCAPSMREVPLDDQTAALEFGKRLVAGDFDALVLLSGGGTRKLIEAASRQTPLEQLRAALAGIPLICRGPKPVAALREHGLKPHVVAPEPNTSDDLLRAMDAKLQLENQHVAVQEYGESNRELLQALRKRGARVSPVLVYAWTLPENTQPLKEAIGALTSQRADAAVFTSARQVVHLFQIAEQLSLDQELRQALNEQVVVASVGPVTSEALRRAGVTPTLEPEHPKMGHLVSNLATRWPGLRR